MLFRSGFAANSGAEGWSIRNASLTIADQSVQSPQSTGALCKLPRDQRAILRLDRMENCRIENIWVRAYQLVRVPKGTGSEKSTDYGTVIQNKEFTTEDKIEYYNPKLLVCSDWARGSTIVTGKREDVVLSANSRGNRIECLADDAGNVRRTYYEGGAQPDLINLAPIRPANVAQPKLGDLILAIEIGRAHV